MQSARQNCVTAALRMSIIRNLVYETLLKDKRPLNITY